MTYHKIIKNNFVIYTRIYIPIGQHMQKEYQKTCNKQKIAIHNILKILILQTQWIKFLLEFKKLQFLGD